MIVLRLFSNEAAQCDVEFNVDFININRGTGLIQYHVPGTKETETLKFRDCRIVTSITSVLMYDVFV